MQTLPHGLGGRPFGLSSSFLSVGSRFWPGAGCGPSCFQVSPPSRETWRLLPGPPLLSSHGRRRVCAPQRTGQPRRLESVPLDEWPAVHQDAYAAYITWDVFVEAGPAGSGTIRQ